MNSARSHAPYDQASRERAAEEIDQAIRHFFRAEGAGDMPTADALHAVGELLAAVIASSVGYADLSPFIRAFDRKLMLSILENELARCVESKGWDGYLVNEENLAPLRFDRVALHEIAIRFAEEEFSRESKVFPTWIIACGTELSWLVTRRESPEAKLLTAAALGAEMRQRGAHAYSRIEAPGSEPAPPGMLSSDERDDTMFVQTVDRDGGVSESRWLVTTRRNGPNLLGPRIDADSEEGRAGADGMMSNLLVSETDDRSGRPRAASVDGDTVH